MNNAMSKKFARRKSGFTIIELLVTITVMVILLGIGLAGYIQFEQKQRVQQSARDVRQLFVETRRKAQVRDQTGCQGDNVTGYADVASYEVQRKVSNGFVSVYSITNCTPDGSGRNVQSLNLPASLDMIPAYDYQLFYTPLTTQVGCPTVPCARLPHTIVISDDQTRFGFTVTKGGQIGGVAPISDQDYEKILEETTEQPGAMMKGGQ